MTELQRHMHRENILFPADLDRAVPKCRHGCCQRFPEADLLMGQTGPADEILRLSAV